MRKFARIVSGIFHPLLMTLYGIILIFMFADLPDEMKAHSLYFIGITFVLTTLVPFIGILVLMKIGLVTSGFDVEKREERIYPYLIAIISYICYLVIICRGVPDWIIAITGSLVLVLCIAMLISMKWKISAHAIGIGGIFGGFTAMYAEGLMNNAYLLIILLFCALMLGISRIALERHTPLQVIGGFALGILVTFSSVNLVV
jgi:membrane-associated phospholipid phosphatase